MCVHLSQTGHHLYPFTEQCELLMNVVLYIEPESDEGGAAMQCQDVQEVFVLSVRRVTPLRGTVEVSVCDVMYSCYRQYNTTL